MSKIKVKPCPCCGNNKLHIGSQGGTRYGVKCVDWEAIDQNKENYGCGLQLSVDYPDDWPKELRGNRGKKSLESLNKWCLEKAIKLWNKRTR